MADLSKELYGDIQESRADNLARELYGENYKNKKQSNPVGTSQIAFDAARQAFTNEISQVPRQLGLTARYGIEGIGDTLDFLATPFRAAQNFVMPNSMQAKTGIASDIADYIGLPKPESNSEKIIGAATRSMAGAGSGIGAFGKASQFASPGATKEVLKLMTTAPKQQLISSAVGGAAGETARQSGAGTGGQITASILGSLSVPTAQGLFNVVGKYGKDAATALMRMALKPTDAEIRSGDAGRAIKTLFENGINVSEGGLEKIANKIDDINETISSKIAGSGERVDNSQIFKFIPDVKAKFSNRPDYFEELNSIESTANKFSNHPFLSSDAEDIKKLGLTLEKARTGKVQALQAAGKLKTFSNQQGVLSQGKDIKLSSSQPENSLYFNVGKSGETAMSPSIKNNVGRIAEGSSGYDDAMAAYTARKAEEVAAQKALEELSKLKNSTPVELAQKLKIGLNADLKDKYGKLGTAEIETYKALQRGLREGVAEKVPGVADLNLKESDLIRALKMVQRGAYKDMRGNPVGMQVGLSPSAAQAAINAIDRSNFIKSLIARGMYNASSVPEYLGNKSGLLNYQPYPMYSSTNGLLLNQE